MTFPYGHILKLGPNCCTYSLVKIIPPDMFVSISTIVHLKPVFISIHFWKAYSPRILLVSMFIQYEWQ